MGVVYQIVVAIFILVFGSFLIQFRKRRKQPPGPLGFPFFGEKPLRIFQFFFPKTFSEITDNQYYINMKNKYGSIWSSDIGNKKIVVLASIDLIKEANIDNGKYFVAKPTSQFYKIMGDNRGIGFSNGEKCHASRQLAVKALRDLGMGKQAIEFQLCDYIDDLMENIERSSSGHISSPGIFIKPISKFSNQIIFNKDITNNDTELDEFLNNIHVLFHSNEACDILEIFSNILPRKYVRKMFSIVDKFLKTNEESLKYVNKLCRDRIKVESEFSKPSCVFDFFWRYRYQDYPDLEYDEKLLDISHSMFDIFVGALDTVANMLSFTCLILGRYRDVQDDIRKEIQLLVDDYKLITMETRKNCPKLLSLIDEIQRFCTLSPRIPRRVESKCTLRNYEITPDDIVYLDLFTSFRDPTLFENPDNFNPYRFLDQSKKVYIQNKSLIPFGIGKRACLGESLGVVELFLFLSKMILKYDISLPKSTTDKFEDILAGTHGLIHSPLNHEIIFQLRNA